MEFLRKTIKTMLENYDVSVEGLLKMLIGYMNSDLIDPFDDLIDFFEQFIEHILELK